MRKSAYQDDAVLRMRFLQGEEDVLPLLAKKYMDVTKFYLYRYREMFKKECDQNDLLQLSLITLHRAIETYKEDMKCTFKTYYSLLLERDFIAYLRSLKTDQRLVNQEVYSLDSFINEEEGGYFVDIIAINARGEYEPERYLRMKELEKEVNQVLQMRPPLEKQIFVLWWRGYSYKEIAQMLEISEKKADNTIQKVKKILKGQLTME